MCACLTSFSVSNDLLFLLSLFSFSLFLYPFALFHSLSPLFSNNLVSVRKKTYLFHSHLFFFFFFFFSLQFSEHQIELEKIDFLSSFLFIDHSLTYVFFVMKTLSKEIRHFMTICYLFDRCKCTSYISKRTDLKFLLFYKSITAMLVQVNYLLSISFER